jgi:UDP-3-O-[3-hydroxymyristoyl] glucosamine N-acyltransferase
MAASAETAMPVILADLAERLGARLRGDGGLEIRGVATLERAGPHEIAYVSDPKYRPLLETTAAGAVILTEQDARDYPGAALVSADPHLCFARAAALLHPPPVLTPGRHPSAVVDEGAGVAASAWIGPHSVIEAGATVADNVAIGPGCFVGRGAAIGQGSRLVAGVTIMAGCVLGRRCLLHPGAVIGADGFGYARDGARWVKVPQLGRVVIGDDVEIGANTTVDRGALGDTVIADGVKLDNLIQIAHNVRIGEHTAIAGCTGIAGSVVIGRRCRIGGQVGITGHLEIADDVTITAKSLVTRSVHAPGVYSSSLPAEEVERWRRNVARLRRLDDLARRLREIEQQLQQSSEEKSR